MTFCYNPNLIPALALGGVLYAVGDYCARHPRPARWWRPTLTALSLVSLLPGLLFILHYAHLFDRALWYYEFRTTANIELFAGLAGLFFGYFDYRGELTKWKRRLFGQRVLLRLGLLFIIAPFLKPILLPVDLNGQLHDMWRDGVCLQSVPGSCGPCSLATILGQYGIKRTELEIARATYTCFTGTENWYLARHIRALGFRAEFAEVPDLASITAPAILGVTVQGRFGHFIALLGKDGENYLIGDPLIGRHTLTSDQFRKEYGPTGFVLRIVLPRGNDRSGPSPRNQFVEGPATLHTDGYEINIEHNCPEGCVSCDNVRLILFDKKTQEVLILTGATYHTMASDGVTPSRFLGYIFRGRNKTYRILNDVFQIMDGNGTILIEESIHEVAAGAIQR